MSLLPREVEALIEFEGVGSKSEAEASAIGMKTPVCMRPLRGWRTAMILGLVSRMSLRVLVAEACSRRCLHLSERSCVAIDEVVRRLPAAPASSRRTLAASFRPGYLSGRFRPCQYSSIHSS